MVTRIRLACLFTTVMMLAGVPYARAQSLRVMTWNIQHGEDGENLQADFIAAQNPDVVILQEVSPGADERYKTLLEQRTLRTWNLKYKPNCEQFYASPSPDAPNPVCTRLDGDGVAILTPLPFQDEPSEVLLWGRDDWTDARRALRVKVRSGGRDVQVFGTHLAAGSAYEQVRISQVNQLVTWMSGFPGPRILGGDLNAVPGSPPMQNLSNAGYADTWAALRSNESGFTHNAKGSLTRRIDYWFSESGSAAQPFSIERPAFPGGPLSDHYAVVAVYTFASAGSGPLVGHWKFDEGSGTTAADSSGNGATGTLVDNPAWVTGKVGGALSFNGTTHLVSIPNQPSWDTVSSTYTVAFWVKVNQIEDYAGAVAVGNWGTRDLEITTTGNRWNARINTTGGPNGWGCDLTSSTLGYLTTVDNTFHHVALVLNAAASRCHLYSDGVLVATDEYVDGTTSFGTQSLHIGGFGDANRLQSVIDDVRLYNAALTQTEIRALAEPGPDTTQPSVAITAPFAGDTVSGPIIVSADAADNVGVVGVQFKLDGQNLGAEDTTPPYSVDWNTASASNGSHDLTAVARDAAGNIGVSASVTVTVNNPSGSGSLVGHWKFDEGSGTTAADSSGHGATGTLINNPAWVPGRVGGALSFNGTTNLVSIPNQPSWDTISSTYTVAFWVKVNQIEDYAGAVAVGNWGTRDLEIMTTGNRWNARIATTGGPNGWGCDVTSPLLGYLTTVDNTFHHVAVVLDTTASRCHLYSDGVLVATDEYVDGTTSFGTQSLNIGGFADANRLQSVIDDVRLYNAALTQSEVEALARAGGGG